MTAGRVCARKLAINQAPGSNVGVLESATIRIGLYENWVEASMRCMFGQRRKRINGVAWLDTGVVFTPESDGINVVQTPPEYTLRGSAGLVLQAAAYYDPSVATFVNQQSGQFDTGLAVGEAGVNAES